jgi:hypothetical protein
VWVLFFSKIARTFHRYSAKEFCQTSCCTLLKGPCIGLERQAHVSNTSASALLSQHASFHRGIKSGLRTGRRDTQDRVRRWDGRPIQNKEASRRKEDGYKESGSFSRDRHVTSQTTSSKNSVALTNQCLDIAFREASRPGTQVTDGPTSTILPSAMMRLVGRKVLLESSLYRLF